MLQLHWGRAPETLILASNVDPAVAWPIKDQLEGQMGEWPVQLEQR